jgi:transposase InsO family protein
MKYHLHMVCLTTHYNVSIPIPNKKALTVSEAIHKELILKYGAPTTILSDLGSEFTADLTRELFKNYGVKCLHSTAAHPTGAAVVERGHRTYNSIMRTLLHKYGLDWSEALPYACYCINTHAIGTTNISPYEMVFGRKPCDPNTATVTRPNVWRFKGGPKFLSPPEFQHLKLEREAVVHEDVKLEFINKTRHNQFTLRKKHYTHRYNVTDLVNRWTANPKVGLYGKLAYKTTGPYEIVGVNPKNPDVYMLRPLGRPLADPTAHHTREICPYITREAHEQQTSQGVSQQHDSMLEVKPQDWLLLPNGKRDFLVKVMKVEGPYVTIQYYNTERPGAEMYEKLKLVWMRQNPSSTEEDIEEVYGSVLKPQHAAAGFQPYSDKIHLNYFYQRILTKHDVIRKGENHAIPKARLAIIRKSKPMTGD